MTVIDQLATQISRHLSRTHQKASLADSPARFESVTGVDVTLTDVTMQERPDGRSWFTFLGAAEFGGLGRRRLFELRTAVDSDGTASFRSLGEFVRPSVPEIPELLELSTHLTRHAARRDRLA